MDFKVRLVRTLDALEGLKQGWGRLSASLPESTGAFSTWEYVSAYVRSFQPPGWCVVAIFSGSMEDVPVAVFPLIRINARVSDAQLVVCVPLGVRFCPYVEFPVAGHLRAHALKALFLALRQTLQCDALLYGPLHEDSKNYLHLIETMPATAIKILRRSALPYIETRGAEFEAFFAGRKKSTLADARRCQKRLAELGSVEFRQISATENLRELVGDLCRLNRAKFPDTHLYRTHEGWQAFFVTLAECLTPTGLVEFSALSLNGEVIASHLGFWHKGRRYYFLPAYSPEFRQYSPSKVLMAHLIEKTFEERGVFCFGAGLLPYKTDWCQNVAEAKMVAIFFSEAAREVMEEFVSWEKIGVFLQ